jgi:hypothetical protein
VRLSVGWGTVVRGTTEENGFFAALRMTKFKQIQESKSGFFPFVALRVRMSKLMAESAKTAL